MSPQIAVSSFNFSLIKDNVTRDVVRDLAGALAAIQAGTVTSVGLSAPSTVFGVSGSPVAGSGTLALSFATQAAGTYFAGPASGAAAVPSFRAPVVADFGARTANTFAAGPTGGAAAAATWRVLDKADLPAEAARRDVANALTGDQTVTTGGVVLATLGRKVSIKSGANGAAGKATLVAGTVTVATTAVLSASSLVMVTPQNTSGTAGAVSVTNIVNATSFDIVSTDAADTRDVAWFILERG